MDDIFDILIGIVSLKKNRFNINLVGDTMYYLNSDFNHHKLADLICVLDLNKATTPLEEESNYESLLLTLTIQKEDLTPIDNKEKKNNIIENVNSKINNEDKIKVKKSFYHLCRCYHQIPMAV